MAESKRKRFTQKEREAVLNKYEKHCAYCGKLLNMHTLRVDHLVPIKKGGSNDFDNLMPACNSCNYYKSSKDLRTFRKDLKAIAGRIEKTFTGNLAYRYGMLHFPPKIVFWFERDKPAIKRRSLWKKLADLHSPFSHGATLIQGAVVGVANSNFLDAERYINIMLESGLYDNVREKLSSIQQELKELNQ